MDNMDKYRKYKEKYLQQKAGGVLMWPLRRERRRPIHIQIHREECPADISVTENEIVPPSAPPSSPSEPKVVVPPPQIPPPPQFPLIEPPPQLNLIEPPPSNSFGPSPIEPTPIGPSPIGPSANLKNECKEILEFVEQWQNKNKTENLPLGGEIAKHLGIDISNLRKKIRELLRECHRDRNDMDPKYEKITSLLTKLYQRS
jgi:hypothetical protein